MKVIGVSDPFTADAPVAAVAAGDLVQARAAEQSIAPATRPGDEAAGKTVASITSGSSPVSISTNWNAAIVTVPSALAKFLEPI